jgi:lysophospholipase L1-like esterase
MDGRPEWFAEDLIHFNEAGAAEMARLVARGILTATHAVQ